MQKLDEPYFEQGQVHDRQLLIHHADQRQQVQTLGRAVPVGQPDAHDGYALVFQEHAELADTLGVGAVGLADRQGSLVNLQAVTALHRSRSFDPPDNWDAQVGHGLLGQIDLGLTQLLPHAAQDHTPVGCNHGVKREDRVL